MLLLTARSRVFLNLSTDLDRRGTLTSISTSTTYFNFVPSSRVTRETREIFTLPHVFASLAPSPSAISARHDRGMCIICIVCTQHINTPTWKGEVLVILRGTNFVLPCEDIGQCDITCYYRQVKSSRKLAILGTKDLNEKQTFFWFPRSNHTRKWIWSRRFGLARDWMGWPRKREIILESFSIWLLVKHKLHPQQRKTRWHHELCLLLRKIKNGAGFRHTQSK